MLACTMRFIALEREKVTSTDEIGRLARTFNVMIDVLRQREREKQRGKLGHQSSDAGRDFE